MEREPHPDDEGQPERDEEWDDRPSDGPETALVSDVPLVAHDRTTMREMQEGESLHTRAARELPDFGVEREDPEREGRTDRVTPGRLVERTVDGRDVTRELEADESGDHAGLSAEEAAMSIVRDDERT